MAIVEISNQYKYTGKGPVDSKQLVKRYTDLLNKSFWQTKSGSNTAYNGMLVSVWMNNDDVDKNGIYYLFDPQCTTTLKNPDVTNESNWHKLGENSLSEEDIQTLINNLRDEFDSRYVKNDDAFAALKQSSIDNSTAIAALIGEDSNKSVREIANTVIADQLTTEDSALGALATLSQDNRTALNALIGEDKNKTARKITKEEISSQIKDKTSDLGALALRIGNNEEAIEALKKSGGVSPEDVYAILKDTSADALIDNSDEIKAIGRQLFINQVGISKLYEDMRLILNGGSARIEGE